MNAAGRPDGLVEMRVSGLDRASDTPVTRVVLEGAADPSTSMTIALPASHAAPLVQALTLADTECSPACDLALAPARRLAAAVGHAVLDRGREGLSARLVLAHDAAPFTLTCDVIDALTLAVRAEAPIYATRRALGRAGINGVSPEPCGTTPREQSPRRS